jgi:prepilin-type N-terminal cleavage/methylation domain-containing protein
MRTATRRLHTERGVTLLELIIAISLVALISGGMLTAMRTSLLTNEKVTARLRSNREHMNLRQMIARQLGGAMPVMAPCASSTGGGNDVSFFRGTPQMLRFVSSFSMAEGSRGYPQIVEYQVAPAAGGGFRLIVNEHPYTGPASAAPFCMDGNIAPVAVSESSVVAADRLSRCQFYFQQPVQQIAFGDLQWVGDWNQPTLPRAVRIEMVPADGVPALLPPLDVIVNLRTDRDFRGVIADR